MTAGSAVVYYIKFLWGILQDAKNIKSLIRNTTFRSYCCTMTSKICKIRLSVILKNYTYVYVYIRENSPLRKLDMHINCASTICFHIKAHSQTTTFSRINSLASIIVSIEFWFTLMRVSMTFYITGRQHNAHLILTHHDWLTVYPWRPIFFFWTVFCFWN